MVLSFLIGVVMNENFYEDKIKEYEEILKTSKEKRKQIDGEIALLMKNFQPTEKQENLIIWYVYNRKEVLKKPNTFFEKIKKHNMLKKIKPIKDFTYKYDKLIEEYEKLDETVKYCYKFIPILKKLKNGERLTNEEYMEFCGRLGDVIYD